MDQVKLVKLTGLTYQGTFRETLMVFYMILEIPGHIMVNTILNWEADLRASHLVEVEAFQNYRHAHYRLLVCF